MKLFLHTLTQIRIINEPLEWNGTPAEFQILEPEYAGLPDGATIRYQTPDVQYYEDANGDRDAFLVQFVDGACAYTYTYRAGMPLGDWFIREEDFITITVGDGTYRVKLAQPVKFTLYRNLA